MWWSLILLGGAAFPPLPSGAVLGGAAVPSIFGVVLLSPLGWCCFLFHPFSEGYATDLLRTKLCPLSTSHHDQAPHVDPNTVPTTTSIQARTQPHPEISGLIARRIERCLLLPLGKSKHKKHAKTEK